MLSRFSVSSSSKSSTLTRVQKGPRQVQNHPKNAADESTNRRGAADGITANHAKICSGQESVEERHISSYTNIRCSNVIDTDTQWWARLIKTVALLTAKPLTKKAALLRLNC